MHGVPTLGNLLSALAPLTHLQRVQKILEVGKQAKTDPGAQKLLAELAQGDVYQRRLATKAAFHTRDGALILRLTQDESRMIRGCARKLVALCCNDEEALIALKECYPVRQHRPILQALRRRNRLVPIDAFLDWLALQPGDTRFADLLPYGSPDCILRHINQAKTKPSPNLWLLLLHYFPEQVALMLQEQVAKLGEKSHPEADLRSLLDLLLPGLSRSLPYRAASLVEALCKRGVPLPNGVFDALIQGCPRVAFDLYLLYQGHLGVVSFERRVGELDRGRIEAALRKSPSLLGAPQRFLPLLNKEDLRPVLRILVELLPNYPSFGQVLLEHLDPVQEAEAREQSFRRYRDWAMTSEGIISTYNLEKLPADLRLREARRHLHEVPALSTRPAQRLAYCAFLSWEEARGILQLYIGHPEGEVRGRAVAILLSIAGSEPERIDEALRMVRARKNEQDPVRLAMLTALCGWKRQLFRKEHLEHIGAIVRDALDAADLSVASARQAEELVLRCFFVDGAFGALWLTTLIKERGQIHNPRLGAYLRDEDVSRAAPQILELASGWALREREPQMLALCQSLGSRIMLVEGPQEGLIGLMIRVIQGAGTSHGAAHRALALLCLLQEHVPDRFLSILPTVGRQWITQGYYNQVIALGQRQAATHVPAVLLDLIEEVLRRTHNEYEANGAFLVLRRLSRQRFEALLPELLSKDRSFAVLPLIHQHIAWCRQDLLTPFLEKRLMTGRFATGKTVWILPFVRGFFRWTPAQHTLFAQALDSVVDDKDRDTPTVFWAIDRRTDLAFTDPGGILRLAQDSRLAVQEKGIRVLGRLDAGQGVETLLECLDDQRARIAIYAFRRAVMELPPSRGLELLASVPLRKVTVAKEVVRLLGELRSEEAYQHLLKLDQPTLHRDIRIALLRGLWDHLERPETWNLYSRAAMDPDWLLSLKLAEIPAIRLTSYSEPLLSELLAQVLLRKEPEARIDLLARAAYLPIRDQGRTFLRACIRLLTSPHPDERNVAMDAVLVRATERDVEMVIGEVGTLFGKNKDQRQALFSCLSRLGGSCQRRSSVILAIAKGVLGKLLLEPLLATQAITLAAAMPENKGQGLVDVLEGICKRENLHVEAALAAKTALSGLTLEPAAKAKLERRLYSEKMDTLRWLGLSVLQNLAQSRGWTEELREQLVRYQEDPSPLVAGAAQGIFPPDPAPDTASSALSKK